MAEEKKLKEWEVQEGLNSEESQTEETKVADDWEKTTYSKEEVEAIKKQMQSDSEKGVQKIIWQKKAYEIAMKELSNISDDPKTLVKLYEENPDAWKIILDTYYEWQDIEDFKNSIWYKVDKQSPEYIEKLAKEKAQEIIKKEKQEQDNKLIEKELESFIEKLKMDKEEKEKFLESFEERRELKSFNVSNLSKHLEKAYKEIADDEQIKALKKQEVIAESMATTKNSWWKETLSNKKNLDKKNSDFNKNFLKERWIL